ncbi:MAG: glutaredoxin family protein [Verrucomicrobia bacterium]|nr:glutaredoxin family protein [Verrucomicrobiota bacterium]
MPVVTLYTKPGCGLCDRAKDVIRGVQCRVAFEFEEKNILDDAALYERYKNDIPVILLDGREIARHRISPQQLRDALAS